MAGIARTSSAFIRKISSVGPTISASHLFFRRGIASKLFIKGLPFSTTESALADEFSKFGEVVEARIAMDKDRNRSKGFGFVTFSSFEDAHKALDDMNGKMLDGRVIYVDMARPSKHFDNYMPIARGPPEPEAEAKSESESESEAEPATKS